MNPLKALRLGLGRAKARRAAMALYWFFHTAMALAVAIPLAGTAIGMVAKTKYGDELLGDFDLMFLLEAVNRAGSTGWVLYGAAVATFTLWIGVIYLNGGAMHVLRRSEEPYSQAMFWEGAGLYFWRFLRVSIYALLAWIPFALFQALSRLTIEKAWGEGMEEAPVYAARQASFVIMLVLAGYAVTVTDYTRARLAAEGSRQALRTLVRTMRWVAANPKVAFGPWAILAVILALATALYVSLAKWIPTPITPMAVIVILLQQSYVLTRVFLRFAGWGAVIEIDRAVWGDNENHEPEQEVFSYVGGGGDGSLRAGATADPETEGPAAG